MGMYFLAECASNADHDSPLGTEYGVELLSCSSPSSLLYRKLKNRRGDESECV